MNCEAVGTACVVLGGGREKKEDAVDPAVGIVLHRKTGDQVAAGEPLCTDPFEFRNSYCSGRELAAREFPDRRCSRGRDESACSSRNSRVKSK